MQDEILLQEYRKLQETHCPTVGQGYPQGTVVCGQPTVGQ